MSKCAIPCSHCGFRDVCQQQGTAVANGCVIVCPTCEEHKALLREAAKWIESYIAYLKTASSGIGTPLQDKMADLLTRIRKALGDE